ncbi:MAG: Fur family transcriptional regulator [Arenicella sp.]
MKPSISFAKVQQKYQRKGISFTEKRQKILTILLEAEQALSAYDIVDAYQKEYAQSMPPMSVYRILDFLIEIGAVHKLESVNQFMACEHAACEHSHQKAQFLICDDCHSVQEIVLGESVLHSLDSSVLEAGFSMKSLQLELHGTCLKCLDS